MNLDIYVNSLKKSKDEIFNLLLEMYPNNKEVIAFHYHENFYEWFAFLFNLHMWRLNEQKRIKLNDIYFPDGKYKQIKEELSTNGEFEQIKSENNIITLVEIDKTYNIVDGYHRVFIAKEKEQEDIESCIWVKKENLHPNCKKIRNLIINNL